MCFAESAQLTVTPRPVTGTKKHNSTEVSIRSTQAKLKKREDRNRLEKSLYCQIVTPYSIPDF